MTQPLEDLAPDRGADVHPLDNPVWSALTGPHAQFAEGAPPVLRYPRDVSPFIAARSVLEDDDWEAIGRLVGPGAVFALAGSTSTLDRLPAGWSVEFNAAGLQFVATDAVRSQPDPEAVNLGPDDVEEMLDLVQRTQPGPFEARTYLLGRYLGVRRDGALVAMAGERLHVPGWTEISAVCTDPAFRGQGLAARLVGAIAHGIRERGETPFLHTAASNVNAIRLYQQMGFAVRRPLVFYAFRTPAG
jgi:ribosomal protein S18 acetylase RimI-like enzyme